MSNFRITRTNRRRYFNWVKRALEDKEKGLGEYAVTVTDEALHHFANASGGDMRSAYNALELAVLSSFTTDDQAAEITLEIAEECLQRRASSTTKAMLIMMYYQHFKNQCAEVM